jgi:E3 ubiquitin-protein ligase HERC3
VPVQVQALKAECIVKIECGDFHSLALTDKGQLYSWGTGEKGECGHERFEDCEVPKRIRYFESREIIDVVAGKHHTLALTSNNEVFAWGDGRYGQCGYGEFESTSIPQQVFLPSLNQTVRYILSCEKLEEDSVN